LLRHIEYRLRSACKYRCIFHSGAVGLRAMSLSVNVQDSLSDSQLTALFCEVRREVCDWCSGQDH
jgi:hypothetical protein